MKRPLYDFLVENNLEIVEGTIQLGDKEFRFEVIQRVGESSVKVPSGVEKLENMYTNISIDFVEEEYPLVARRIANVVPEIIANRFSVIAKGKLL